MTATRLEDALFDFPGEVPQLLRGVDWAASDVGHPDTWPQSLRTALSIILGSRYPMFVWWGPSLTNFYNDAYRPILGADKHPQYLGGRARECWHEIWDVLGPLSDKVMREGAATYAEDLLLVMERNGYVEETYFTFSYSPVRKEDGGVGGVFCACFETTDRVIQARRLSALKELAIDADTIHRSMQAIADNLRTFRADIPSLQLYGQEKDAYRLLATNGPDLNVAVADVLGAGDLSAATPAVVRLKRPIVTDPWPEPVTHAYVAPLAVAGRPATEAIVLGISPRREFDADYQSFVQLVVEKVSAIIDGARAREAEHARAESLAALDRAKTAFFTNISHEFRTPLTLLLGPIEDALAEFGVASPDLQRERLDVSHRNATRLLRLVNALLDFSRIEAGRIEAAYEPVDLAALTRDLSSMFESAFERAGVGFRIECEDGGEPVYVDGDMWEKVVMNLLSNAFKFTFEGEVAVSLRQHEGKAWLRVSDTGVGISEDDARRLFERFHRVEGVRARTHEGTGIGLALVRDLVRLHGGTVEVESAPGAGTTFTAAIPLGHDHLPADRVRATRTMASTALAPSAYVDEALRWLPGSADGGDPSPNETAPKDRASELSPAFATTRNARVLLVDDNADMRDYAARLLRANWQVETATDGEDALRRIAERPPDLVLADVMMPGVDGFELLRRLRADPERAHLPVILLSARAGEDARVEGLEAGADDYLVKPFSSRELLARVGAHLAIASLRRESEERWRSLAEVMPGMVWLADAHGAPLYYNAHALAFTGCRFEELMSYGWLHVSHPDDAGAVTSAWEAAVAAGLPLTIEYRVRRHDGVYRWHLWLYAPVRNEAGEVTSWVGTAVDIDERRQVEDELRAALSAKDDFLGLVSHELRTPLTTVLGNAQILRREGGQLDTESHRAALSDIVVDAERLERIINDMLALARIDRGHPAEMEPVSIARCIEQSVRHHRRQYPGRTVEVSARRDLPLANANPDYVVQILVNLLSNAAKYSPPGSTIEVVVVADEAEVVTQVLDRGSGIADSALADIFSPFVRGKGTESVQGLGVGLTVCKRLVEAQGGAITAVPRPGGGTIFQFTLPVAIEE